MNRWTVYVAGPLFSIAEQNFNTFLVSSLVKEIPKVTFILAQNYSKKIAGQSDFFEKMFKYCLDCIDQADGILCILDGPDVDSGTAVEMGYAYARNKPIVGVRSDFRGSEEEGVNLMVSRICTEILWLPSSHVDSTEFVSKISASLNRVIK